MFEQFDDLTKQIEDEKDSHKNAPAQWELLKYSVSQLSSRSFDDHPFALQVSQDGASILQLSEVAAQFFDESKRGGR